LRLEERHSFFIHQWLYSPLLGPVLFFSSIIFFPQTVGLLGRVISPSQGRYLHTGQHKHRINAYTDIHALSGIRTHDPSVRAIEDTICLRLRGHCDRRFEKLQAVKLRICHSGIRWHATRQKITNICETYTAPRGQEVA
jgi:hypothetical protein